MTEKPNKLSSFFHEVWRRRVLQVALPYCVGGWLLIEVSDVVLGAFEAPNWVLQAILIVFLCALPVVIVLAWIFDITPAGLVRTGSADEEESAGTPDQPTPSMALSLGDSERRQVTMLRCAFNFQSGQDPEEDPEFLRDAILALEGVFASVATRFNGHRLRSSAEELTLVFGYPVARDDDARRAVAAGLALLDAAQLLDENHDGIPDLAVHVGVHTGLVVVDESQKSQEGIKLIGQVPRIVSWLQTMAPADSVTISSQTRDLVSRFYSSGSLGEFNQPQLGGQVEIYRVEAGTAPNIGGEFLDQVGREQELSQLQARWQHALDGDGQFVLVKGEPGIGKSSLIRAFEQGVVDSGSAWVLSLFCSPYEQNTALYPIVQALQGPLLGFEAGDSKATKWQRLESFVERRCPNIEDALPLLARLLSLPLPEGITPLSGSPQLIRSQTLELLLHVIRQQAGERPFLLVIEDLLWADPTTLEWIRMTVEEGPSKGVFLLLTARPSFTADWTKRSYVLVMDLLPLASRAVGELLRRTAGEVELPEALVEHIIRETGGNPLYVHELTRAVLESGEWRNLAPGAQVTDLGWMKIPATLQDSLAARIDHLGPAKAMLQLCSVLGREFDYKQLLAVSGTENETALRKELDTIVDSELLFKRGSSGNPKYSFKHMLIQETAYNSLLKSKRKEVHLRTANILQKDYEELTQQQPALLAWHFGEGGEPNKAIELWAKATRLSLQAFANHEAITQARKGLTIVKSLPPSEQRTVQEIPLRSMLGMALLATRGYGAPEVREAFTRALELCEKAGEAPQLFQVVVGLWMYYLISARHEKALELSQTLMRIADSSKDPGQRLQARYCLGYTLYYRAEYHDARKYLELAIASEEEGVNYAAFSASGDDTRSHVRIWLAHLNWHLGLPQTAMDYMEQALKLARKEGNPFGIAFVTFNAAWFHVIRRDAARSLPLSRTAVEMANANGYGFFKPLAGMMLAWSEGRAKKTSLVPADRETVQRIRGHMDNYRKTGAELGISFHHLLLAEDLVALQQWDEAETCLQSASQHVEKTGEVFLESEVYRLQGRLCLQRDPGDAQANAEAIELLRKALEIAHRCHSVVLQRRAATDLAEALAANHLLEEAQQVLSEAMDLVTEKDDSGDAKQAEQLLKSLKKQMQK